MGIRELSISTARAVAVLALASVSGASWSYAEYGYFGGAYASTGSPNCVGDGINPYGGCTPGTFPLALAHAELGDANGHFSSATADIASAMLSAQAQVPDRANGAGAAANFIDTLTIVGPITAPVDVVLTLRVDSNIVHVGPSWQESAVQASLMGPDGGVFHSYVRVSVDGSCYWPTYGGADCSVGDGPDSFAFSRTVTVTDASRSFQTGATLYVQGWNLDVDATVHLDVTLPDGLGYTSASGVFASAVPEPSAWALFGAGIGLLSWRRRFAAAPVAMP